MRIWSYPDDQGDFVHQAAEGPAVDGVDRVRITSQSSGRGHWDTAAFCNLIGVCLHADCLAAPRLKTPRSTYPA